MSRVLLIVTLVISCLHQPSLANAQPIATVTFRLIDGEICKPFSNLDCASLPRVDVVVSLDNTAAQPALVLEAQTVQFGDISHQLFGHSSSLGKGPQFRRMYLNYRAPIVFDERGENGVGIRTVIKATNSGIKPRRTSVNIRVTDSAQRYELQYLQVPQPGNICPLGTIPTVNAPSTSVVAPRIRASVNVDDIPGWLDSRIADAINRKVFDPISNAMGNLVLLGFGKPTLSFSADGGTDIGVRLTVPFRGEEESIVAGGLAAALSFPEGTTALQVLWEFISSETDLQPKLNEFGERLVTTKPGWRVAPRHLNWFCRGSNGDNILQ